jgi:hypothetical protein
MYSICTCSFLVSGTSKTLLFECEPWIRRLLFSSCLFLEEKTFNFVFFANEEDESAQIIFTERWFVWCCCCCELIWYEVYTPLAYDIALRCHVKNGNTHNDVKIIHIAENVLEEMGKMQLWKKLFCTTLCWYVEKVFWILSGYFYSRLKKLLQLFFVKIERHELYIK